MFEKILRSVTRGSGNVIKDSGECSRRLWRMFRKIPGISIYFVKSCLFLLNFAVKLLENIGKKQLLSNSFRKIFYTISYN